MSTITIPKRLTQKGDLIIVPRKEYEALIGLRRMKKFTPTVAQKEALARAETNPKKGKRLPYSQALSEKKALGILREGMREYKTGKTRQLRTLSDLRYGN